MIATELGVSVGRENVEGKRSCSNVQSNDSLREDRLRNITEADIPKIAEVRKALKIHDCTSSLYSFHKLDPEAIVVAENEDGKIVATHSMLNFADGLYISGLTYVHHGFRNNNLALEMIRKGTVRHKHKNRLLISHTFEAWAKNSEEIVRFKMETGFVVEKYISTENVDTRLLSDDLPEDVSIHPFDEGHLDSMYEYDLQVAGYERRRYLELSCHEPSSKTLVALKKGLCVGFGTIKLSCPGAKRVGPLYADDPMIAEVLLKALLKGFQKGKGVAIVIPRINLKAQKLAKKLNIPFILGLHQIYEKGFPQADVNKAYAHFDLNGTSI